MKKLLLSIFFLSSAFCAWAQNDGLPFHEHDEETGLFLGGSLTYWAAGIMLGYGFDSERVGGVKSITRIYKVSPFVRYYYMHRGPFNLYLDGGMGFNHSKPEQNTATKRNGYEIGIRPGVCVDLAKGFCLCMRMGFAGYRNNYFVGEEHEVGDNGFGLRFAPEELMIGLELEF